MQQRFAGLNQPHWIRRDGERRVWDVVFEVARAARPVGIRQDGGRIVRGVLLARSPSDTPPGLQSDVKVEPMGPGSGENAVTMRRVPLT